MADEAHWKVKAGLDTSIAARARRDPNIFRENVILLLQEISEKLSNRTEENEFGPALVEAPVVEEKPTVQAPLIEEQVPELQDLVADIEEPEEPAKKSPGRPKKEV